MARSGANSGLGNQANRMIGAVLSKVSPSWRLFLYLYLVVRAVIAPKLASPEKIPMRGLAKCPQSWNLTCKAGDLA
ncbi:MAG: hypothetical protein P8L78_04950 [Mariniblastus sp.]|nr:hypothetical protein [Mariniblastus sp.]